MDKQQLYDEMDNSDVFAEAVKLLIEAQCRLELITGFNNLDRVDYDYTHHTITKIKNFLGETE